MTDDGAHMEAKVVECFGRRAIVQLVDGARKTAAVFGKRTEILCGDRVRLRPGGDELQIVEVLPRASTFARTDSRGRKELLAANLTLIAVVMAPEPTPDLFIVDRYLAGAAYAHLRTVVIANKCDIAPHDTERLLSEYRQAGHRTLGISAKQGLGISELKSLLNGETFMLVGQSGVGKSTLTNSLVPASIRAIRALSTASGEGRHTTVSAALFDFDDGALIDSPGVRDYAPPPIADDAVQVGWPEILALAPQCRFNNCLHLREPGCAVIAAIENGTIATRRYESYKRLLNLMRQLLPAHERK